MSFELNCELQADIEPPVSFECFCYARTKCHHLLAYFFFVLSSSIIFTYDSTTHRLQVTHTNLEIEQCDSGKIREKIKKKKKVAAAKITFYNGKCHPLIITHANSSYVHTRRHALSNNLGCNSVIVA